jgi:histone deacetylase 11
MKTKRPVIIYNQSYNIHLWGIEKLHPFEGRKFEKVWNGIKNLELDSITDFDEISIEDLLTVHSERYIERLKSANYVFNSLEIPIPSIVFTILRFANLSSIVDSSILKPMRFACEGTKIGAYKAIELNSIVFNIGGGFHHASREKAHGFCFYADIAIAIECLRRDKVLENSDKVLIIDLDAHQSDGNERIFKSESNVHIIDVFNEDIFPQDNFAAQFIKYPVRLNNNCKDELYLNKVEEIVNQVIDSETYKIVFYIAGTDIYEKDPLGNLKISREGIIRRDTLILNKCFQKSIPTLMVTAGGYTPESPQIIIDSIHSFLN